jgi:hypothetical protein
MLLAVAALMVMMEMAMVAPAFADPPDKGPTGCGVGLGAFADPPGVAKRILAHLSRDFTSSSTIGLKAK